MEAADPEPMAMMEVELDPVDFNIDDDGKVPPIPTCFICNEPTTTEEEEGHKLLFQSPSSPAATALYQLLNITPTDNNNRFPIENEEELCSTCNQILHRAAEIYKQLNQLNEELQSYKQTIQQDLDQSFQQNVDSLKHAENEDQDQIDLIKARKQLQRFLLQSTNSKVDKEERLVDAQTQTKAQVEVIQPAKSTSITNTGPHGRGRPRRRLTDIDTSAEAAVCLYEALIERQPVVKLVRMVMPTNEPKLRKPQAVPAAKANANAPSQQKQNGNSTAGSSRLEILRARLRDRRRLQQRRPLIESDVEEEDNRKNDHDFRVEECEEYIPTKTVQSKVEQPTTSANANRNRILQLRLKHDAILRRRPKVAPQDLVKKYSELYKKCPADNCSKAFISKKGLIMHIRTYHKFQYHSLLKKVMAQPPKPPQQQQNRPGQPPQRPHSQLPIAVKSKPVETVTLDDVDDDPFGDKQLQRPPKREEFMCMTCGRVFGAKDRLEYHMESHKPESERRYRCSYGNCTEVFPNPPEFRKHRRIHEREEAIAAANVFTICEVCGKCVQYIKRHMQTHAGDDKFECEVCHITVNSRRALSSHKVIHYGERQHKCETCGMAFHKPSGLTRHMTTHSSEKPFVCSFCGKGFRRKQGLADHTNIHTKEKPYRCEICGRRYADKTELDQHVSTDHTAEQLERKRNRQRNSRTRNNNIEGEPEPGHSHTGGHNIGGGGGEEYACAYFDSGIGVGGGVGVVGEMHSSVVIPHLA